MSKFRVACIQNCADNNTNANVARVEELVRVAQQQGAVLICLPECFSALYPTDAEMVKVAQAETDNQVLQRFRALAKKLNVYLLLGSIMVLAEKDRAYNRSYIITANGDIEARYEKIHLFDVRLKNSEAYQESEFVKPGTQTVIAKLPFANVGMSICYDVRFPHLYRHLAQQGAQCLAVPAAFTKTTGQAHWHTLLKARAIETTSFVFAPNQCGARHWGRETFGHSLIVDPWGNILAEAADDETVIIADIDLSLVDRIRAQVPSLTNNALSY